MDDDVKDNLTSRSTWVRGLYMLLFALLYGVAEMVVTVVVVFQFAVRLFTGRPNDQLLVFGQSLATYLYQILLFLTFRSETHPFPFSPWPEGSDEPAPVPRQKAVTRRKKSGGDKPAEDDEAHGV